MKTILRPSGEHPFWVDALRDLVIVIVGILAALWLESWWQDRLDRQEEENILAGLSEEFATNRAELASLIVRWAEIRNEIQEVHSFMGGPVNEDTLADFRETLIRYGMTRGGTSFDPRHGQLTSVLDSGKLGLIENSSLRALIADWPAVVDDLKFDESLLVMLWSGSWGELQSEYARNWPDSQFESRLDELIMDRRYDFGLGNANVIHSIMIREAEGLLETTDAIIAMIEIELGDR